MRREEEEDAQMCPCGKAKESRSRIVGECEMHQGVTECVGGDEDNGRM